MPGLIDHILDNIVVEQLSRAELCAYVHFVSETLRHNLTADQRTRYQQLYLLLNARWQLLEKQDCNPEPE